MSIDTVNDLTPRVQYVALAVQTVFDYPFPIFQDSDLIVYVNGVLQTLNTDYTVAGEGNDLGGTITFSLPLVGGEIVTIYRGIAIERDTDISQNGQWSSSAYNDEQDKIFLILQQLKEQLARSLRMPIISTVLDSELELDPVNYALKYLSFDATGRPTPAVLSATTMTQAIIGQLFYPRSAAEISAGVTPVNFYYQTLCVDRYATNTTPGTTSMRNAWQAAIDSAKKGGGEITYGATAPYLIDSSLNCTVPVGQTNRFFSIRGVGASVANALPTSAPLGSDIVAKFNGLNSVLFDFTGTLGVFLHDMTITTDATTYPEYCFAFARNTDGRSMQVRADNIMVNGSFKKAIRMLYGCEESVWKGCQLFNRAQDANAKVNIFTQRNIRTFASAYVAIATGSQSSICYNDIGCSQMMFSNQATADVYELDNVNFGQIIGGWAACANGTGGGRSIIYVNMTNGMASGWLINGLTCEASAPSAPSYGIRFGTESSIAGANWTLVNSVFPHTVAMIGGGNIGTSLGNLNMVNLSCQGVGTGGVNFGGILSSPFENGVEGAIAAAGGVTTPNFHRLNMWLQNTAECNITMIDSSSGANAKGIRLRQTGGQFVVAMLDDTNTVISNALILQRSGTTPTLWDFSGTTGVNLPRVGFNGTGNIAKPTVTGAKGGNAALASLCTALASYGLIVDSTT